MQREHQFKEKCPVLMIAQVGPVLGAVGMAVCRCWQLAGLTAQEGDFLALLLPVAGHGSRSRLTNLWGLFEPCRVWCLGSKDGNTVAPESGPRKSFVLSSVFHSLPTTHLPGKQSLKSRKQAQAGVPEMLGAQGLSHRKQIKTEKSRNFN